ncbi:hypothetical protein GQR58_029466 [Nymphon striatum]|nr:hypothetical protein GQR58_029466 [Nymphon striatum]
MLGAPPELYFAVQTRFAKFATNSINEEYGTNINIDRLQFSLISWDTSLKGIYIEDYEKDTLFYVDNLTTSILNVRNLVSSKLEFGDIDVDGLDFKLKTYKDSIGTNLEVFIDKLDDGKARKPGTPPFFFSSSNVEITNSTFRLIDENRETAEMLDFKRLNISAQDFQILGPEVSTGIKAMSFDSKRGLHVDKLSTDFKYTKQQMRFDSLAIQTPGSELKGKLTFNYDRKDFKEFLDKVKLEASFTESTVAFDEINLLYNQFGTDNTGIRGDFNFKNLFSKKESFVMNARMKNVTSSYYELRSLLPNILGKLPTTFKKLGQFTVRGDALVTETSINAKVNLNSAVGSSYADLELTNINNIDDAQYKGFVSLIDFDLGSFAESKNLGKTNLDFNVEGKGFVKESLNTEVIGNVNMDITGNTLDNIVGDIKFTKTNFTNVNDTYYFEDFKVSSSFENDSLRTIDINSKDIITGYLKGNFKVEELGLKKSDISFKDNTWVLNKDGDSKNKVIINRTLDSISIEEIVMNNEAQEQIRLRGTLADSTSKDLQLQFKIVSLDKIAPVIDSLNLEGEVNGILNIFQKDGIYLPSSNLGIDDFSINGMRLGDLTMGIVGNKDLTDFVVNTQITDNGIEKLGVVGNIINKGDLPQAQLLANFRDFDLEPFSPLGEGVIDHIRGLINGSVRINGDIDNPSINGLLTLNNAGRIYGPTKALTIKVDGETARGTSINIPLSDVVSLGDYSFINFIDKNSIKTIDEQRVLNDVEGLELEFDLAVTPDAEVKIVTDTKTGSTLKGTGEGLILMRINTRGKFNMFGDFVVVTGEYNYKYGGFIDKTFQVKTGGTINWQGDPLAAELRMQAVYNLNANPAPLLDNPNYSRSISTDVVIGLTGPLEKPNIDFEIEFPGTNSIVQSELEYRLQDPTVEEKNALFLLTQGSFVNDQSGINEQAITGTITQSVTSMLNQLISSDDDKFKLGVDYQQGNTDRATAIETDSRLGVTVSTKISDRLLFNGKVGVPVGGATETIVAGDFEIQLLLNEEGSLSAKFFSRESEIQEYLGDRVGSTQGAGLSYEVDFNSFKELWSKIFKKNKEGRR